MAVDLDLNKFLFQGVSGTMISTIILCILALIFLAGLGGFAYWWKKRRVYDITVRMYSKRFGTWKTWDEKGAIFKDKKTGDAFGFRLKGESEDLSPPPYSCMIVSLKGNNIIHMLQEATGQFYYLNPCVDDITKLKETDKHLALQLKVIPEDVRLWSSTARERLEFIYNKKPWWKDLLAFLPFVVCAVLIIILIYSVLQQFSVLKDVSANLAEAAKNLKDLHSTGALVPTAGV